MEYYKLNDVFGISRNIPLNYVERKKVDDKLRDALNQKKHISIFGSSKQGKTCLRKHCLDSNQYIIVQCTNKMSNEDLNEAILKAAGFEITLSKKMASSGKEKIVASIKAKLGLVGEASIGGEIENSSNEEVSKAYLELDSSDVNDIIKALSEIGFNKHIVIEDFHYLKSDVQKTFSTELKAFHENTEYCFLIVGVWLDENRLTVYNGDLVGRIIPINADEWNDLELREVINRGADLLNISFDKSCEDSIIKLSAGNVFTVQEVCAEICREKGIKETQSIKTEVGRDVDVEKIVKEYINSQSGRYNKFIENYSVGFQESALKLYKYIMMIIIESTSEVLLKGLKFKDIRERIDQIHPNEEPINPGNVTQALHFSASLQLDKGITPIIIDYDNTARMLRVVDKSFINWLEFQNKEELLELLEYI